MTVAQRAPAIRIRRDVSRRRSGDAVGTHPHQLDAPVRSDRRAQRPSGSPNEGIKVLHVVEAFGGGVFEQLRHLTARLPSHGVASTIAYGRRLETPAEPRDVIAPDVELIELRWGRRTVSGEIVALRAIRRVMRDVNPDVVHLHSSFAGLLGALATPRGVPTVYTPHGYSFTMTNRGHVSRLVFREIETLVGARVDVIGAVSRSEQAAAVALGVPAEIVVVENGIPELDHPHRLSSSRHGARPRVVAMGRIGPARRPADAARILAGVADIADVEWIGDGPDARDRAMVERMGVPVSGWLPRAEAVKRLQRADIYLHCAGWDGQPLSVLEALAVGCVVVGSNIPPLRDIVPDVQRFDTPEEAVSVLRALLADQELANSCRAAQARIAHLHSANRMAWRWANVYGGLLAVRRRSRHARRAVEVRGGTASQPNCTP